MIVTALIVAKAPVPGLAKTRLAATIGDAAAAELAAASLLDTLDAVSGADVDRRVVALTGTLAAAARADELTRALASFTVIAQRGDALGERLANAHADAATTGAVLQIGMDTPQVTATLLTDAAAKLRSSDVLGFAEDGGWWALGLRNPGLARALLDVPMSTPSTGVDTLAALTAAGASVTMLTRLRDVDFESDLQPVSQLCSPMSRFRTAVEKNRKEQRI
ncbi:TIGR04282 family arsenosugar biosynthesis glycosyltransferase [Rhodococcus sp. 077-4]|uniref:TIGR04282 family arsenosugar biosynthesis glycosyltransferase n=1 Tax=Rhodococcus sp. 077-4 TaxID=2789271 RepID=UPI0039F50161